MFYLKFLRIDRKLTQDHLAAATGYVVRQAVLSQIESGRTIPNDRELAALAHVLGVPAERLMDHVSGSSLPAGAEARDKAVRS